MNYVTERQKSARKPENIGKIIHRDGYPELDWQPFYASYVKTHLERARIEGFLGVKTVLYAMQHYVKPLLDHDQLRMTIPDKPKSSKQMFYIG